jgi:RNA polymerase sigma-70 factor (ECF subfamily)
MESDRKIAIYLTHRPALVDYAARIVGCRSRAEDVVQEAFLRFVPSDAERDRTDSVLQPVNYLYQIVRNLALDWMRRLSVERSDGAKEMVWEVLPAATASPEQEALYRDELRVVAAALAELPIRTQLVFKMHRLAGYTLQEIADELGISVTLAHQLITKALRHCASRLDDDGV